MKPNEIPIEAIANFRWAINYTIMRWQAMDRIEREIGAEIDIDSRLVDHFAAVCNDALEISEETIRNELSKLTEK